MTKNQTLILVDEKDKQVGYASREECHKGVGKKHRAFVTLLFDSQNRVTLQKRRHRLFDNLWDLTAVSHPLHRQAGDESYQDASDRALAKEMGVPHVPVEQVGAFNYFSKDGANCENEYCTILVGYYDGEYKPNKDEVYEIRQVDFSQFIGDIKKHDQKYTPWAQIAAENLIKLPNLAKIVSEHS